jgi:choline-glycine betaine transporter
MVKGVTCMQYPVNAYPAVSCGYTSNSEGAHTSFFPLLPFAAGVGLGILPWAVAGAAYRGCRGPYCGGGCGPYCGGPYWGPGWGRW